MKSESEIKAEEKEAMTNIFTYAKYWEKNKEEIKNRQFKISQRQLDKMPLSREK